MSKATEDLRHEHEAITSALRILDRMLERSEGAGTVDQADARAFIGFLKEFADKCHHGKEEGILFPALVAAGIPAEGEPVGAMLAEHAEGRRLIGEMEAAIAGTPDLAKFAVAARKYQGLLRSHIRKENTVLFPLADRTLGEARANELFESFEEHEEKVIGHGRHEQLHALLEELKRKYS